MTASTIAFEYAWTESIQFNRAGGSSYEKAFAFDAWQKSKAQFIKELKTQIESHPEIQQSDLIAWLDLHLAEPSLSAGGMPSKDAPTALEIKFNEEIGEMISIEP